MITQKIRPDNGSREGKWVALTIAGILAVSTILLPHHQTETEHTDVQSHQVLITDLEQEELAMIAELKLAHEEIRDLHLDAGECLTSANWKNFGLPHLCKTKAGSEKALINGNA